jgi:aminopeptidase YwaD
VRLLLLFFVFHSCLAQAQQYNKNVNDIASNAHRLTEHLYAFDRLGIKEPGNPELNKTRDWLIDYYNQLGYIPQLDSFKLNTNQLYNIIAEKKGISEKYIIVCGHYDTRTGVGANDNGSGVAVIMEMARLLKDIETKYSIRFINFTGEELGLLGSIHYANNIIGANDSNLMFILNIDQLGGSKGQNENFKIKCESDQDDNPSHNNASSLQITQYMAKVLSLYTSLTPVLDRAYSSDYIPFENLGYTITGLYQFSSDPFNHSANDIVENMDTVSFKEIGKGSIACLLHFAEATFIACLQKEHANAISFYPNPTNGKLNISIENSPSYQLRCTVYHLDGRMVYAEEITDGELDLSKRLTPGFYILNVSDARNQSYYKRISIIATMY